MFNADKDLSRIMINSLSEYTDVDPEEWDCETGKMRERYIESGK